MLIDYSAIKLLKESGKISNDAVFVNGNSGDFITGGHMLHNNYLDFDKLIKVIINNIFFLHSLESCRLIN